MNEAVFTLDISNLFLPVAQKGSLISVSEKLTAFAQLISSKRSMQLSRSSNTWHLEFGLGGLKVDGGN